MSIIKKVVLKNFYNFHSENTFHFRKGLNVVIGDNAMGKSKFFNAIKWILDDRVYDEDKGDWSIILGGEEKRAFNLISKRALSEANEKGARVETSVMIEFQSTEDEHRLIQLVKKVRCERIKDVSEGVGEDCWMIDVLDEEVYLSTAGKYKPINNIGDKSRYKDELIPAALRRYLLFRGEGLSNIISSDSSDSSSLKNALNLIAKTSLLETYINNAKYFQKRKKREKEEIENTYVQNKENLESQRQTVSKKQDEVAQAERLKGEYEVQLQEAQEQLASQKEQIAGFQKASKAIGKVEEKEKQLEKLIKNIYTVKEKANEYFFRKESLWVTLGTEDVYNRYWEMILEAREDRQKARIKKSDELKLAKYEMPKGSPDYASLEKMVKEKVCFVCGRSTEEDDEAHKQIVNLLKFNTKNEKPDAEVKFKNSFNSFFEEISRDCSNLVNEVKAVPSSMNNFVQRLNRLDEDRKVLEQDIFSLKEGIRQAGVDMKNKDSINTILNNFEHTKDRINKYKNYIRWEADKLKQLYPSLSQARLKLKKMGEVEEGKRVREEKEIIDEAVKLMLLAKESVIEKLVSRLQTNSNQVFDDLTAFNKITASEIVFERYGANLITTKMVNAQGDKVPGLAQGVQNMRRLAIVVGLLKSSSYKKGYPFIADAPLSTFGDGFIKGFLNTIPKEFPQTIITSKEFVKESKQRAVPSPELNGRGEELLRGFKIGSDKTKYEGTVCIIGSQTTAEEDDLADETNLAATINYMHLPKTEV